MKHKLLAYVSRFIVSVAFLAFVVAGSTFNHALANHNNHIHQGQNAEPAPHSHPEFQRSQAIELDPVHCGANLLALTFEIRPEIPLTDEVPDPFGTNDLLSEVEVVDPPPPRFLS